MSSAAAARPRARVHESSYTTTPTADGWTQFDVTGAKGITAPWMLLPMGTFMGGYIAWGMYNGLIPTVIVGVVMGSFWQARTSSAEPVHCPSFASVVLPQEHLQQGCKVSGCAMGASSR